MRDLKNKDDLSFVVDMAREVVQILDHRLEEQNVVLKVSVLSTAIAIVGKPYEVSKEDVARCVNCLFGCRSTNSTG